MDRNRHNTCYDDRCRNKAWPTKFPDALDTRKIYHILLGFLYDMDQRGGGLQRDVRRRPFSHEWFGYRSLDELEYAFADCEALSEVARVILNILFPKYGAYIWAIAWV